MSVETPSTPRSTKTTTQNTRCTEDEKEAWRAVAPNGDVSKWLRRLANKAARYRQGS